MGLLSRFLYQSMKGLRALVVLAAIITVLQVSCDIAAAFPLKFIPSKVQNPGNDPACLPPCNPTLTLRRDFRYKRSARSTRTIRVAASSWCGTPPLG